MRACWFVTVWMLLAQGQGAPSGYCLKYEFDFRNTDVDVDWAIESTSRGGGNEEFQSYLDQPDILFQASSDGLHIRPKRMIDLPYPYTKDFLDMSEVLNLNTEYNSCTDSSNYGCYRNGGNIPPIASAKIKSIGSFQFGRIEIEAQMPVGDWIWPAIWLWPKNETGADADYPHLGEMDIAEARGNDEFLDANSDDYGNSRVSSAMHYCSSYKNTAPDNVAHKDKGNGKNAGWTKRFHTYGLDWTDKTLKFMVDDNVILDYDLDSDGPLSTHCNDATPWGNTVLEPFNKPFRIHINCAVGGRSNFFHPSFTPTRPWSSTGSYKSLTQAFNAASGSWLSTWTDDFIVQSVKVYAKPGQVIYIDEAAQTMCPET